MKLKELLRVLTVNGRSDCYERIEFRVGGSVIIRDDSNMRTLLYESGAVELDVTSIYVDTSDDTITVTCDGYVEFHATT